ncbi:MAG: (d)CMP kinase [Cyclobacteriaceae bacterium]|nr:(d)CMP kinase [Cyclobacteriaceae bacterium]MCX7636872.1 (d)CMP kinase [Cyclobacteriaceae bacterium]MDW8330242.1 (d)CMP kinase [Cyclobacteriaceae bacterium]
MKRLIIAIDGYSACGKSTTARAVARILGYRYIDTGAMYRAVTLYFLDHHVAITNPKEVARALDNITISFRVNPAGDSDTYLNGLNVEQEIRELRVAESVSQVSALKPVREKLVQQQRKIGKDKGIVMDGRDIGTVVFPDADLKFFMTADITVRAERRQRELLEKNILADLDSVIQNIMERDRIDTTRSESPLRQAPDAIVLDTTHLTIDEQVDEVVRRAVSLMLKPR